MQGTGSPYARRFQTPTPERISCPARILSACRKPSFDLSIALARRSRIAMHFLAELTTSRHKAQRTAIGVDRQLAANSPDYRPGHTSILRAGWFSVHGISCIFLYIITGVRAVLWGSVNARGEARKKRGLRAIATAASATRHRPPRCSGQARAEPGARRQTSRRKKSRAEARRRKSRDVDLNLT